MYSAPAGIVHPAYPAPLLPPSAAPSPPYTSSLTDEAYLPPAPLPAALRSTGSSSSPGPQTPLRSADAPAARPHHPYTGSANEPKPQLLQRSPSPHYHTAAATPALIPPATNHR